MSSWSQRKPKNRRVERHHILEVKVRSQQARSERVRLASSVVAVILGTGAGLFLFYHVGLWILEEGVLRNEAFTIRTLDIQTDGQVPIAEIRRRIEVQPGDNLLALDLSRVKRELELDPWIEQAVVERVLPHTLRIRVAEREPIARVYAFEPRGSWKRYGPVVFQVDSSGHVMRPRVRFDPGITANMSDEYLPTLAGIHTAELKHGQRLESPLAHAALRLIDAFEGSAMFGVAELATVDLVGPDILRVVTREGSELVFCVDDFATQLQRWHAIHEAGLRMNKAVASLDLSVTNNLPARWTEARAVPSANPKSVKPTRPRKRHV